MAVARFITSSFLALLALAFLSLTLLGCENLIDLPAAESDAASRVACRAPVELRGRGALAVFHKEHLHLVGSEESHLFAEIGRCCFPLARLLSVHLHFLLFFFCNLNLGSQTLYLKVSSLHGSSDQMRIYFLRKM